MVVFGHLQASAPSGSAAITAANIRDFNGQLTWHVSVTDTSTEHTITRSDSNLAVIVWTG